MFCSPEIRRPSEQRANPKLENRNPKEIRDQKSEGRASDWTFSDFGFRISFGFRFSDFGSRVWNGPDRL